MEKYKNQAIIGHFGLGFYSAFMVSDKVEIFTKSYKEGSKTVHWSCTGSPEFEMEETDEARDRGTTIVLHLSEDSLEYAEDAQVEALLKKYCRFLPVPIAFGKVKEWKDGKYVDTDKDNIINNVEPLWTRKPADITEEQYKEFYRELYPMSDEPLFSIHLNIDYPFHLTGILYFPKIHNNFEIQKNKIQLYSNQVYVTDQVEGIVPEYLTLLHGVIDSPDIPLNVSRSYLQSDANVKKISSYITRKVADRLQELFSTMRSDYEAKWDDLKIFIQYGILTDEKFAEKAAGIMLWKNVEGKYFTPKEYAEKVKENQTDKNKTVVFLYVDDPVEKHTFLEAAKGKGYDVLVMDGQLDSHYINWYESKNKESRFVRVDSDVVDKLIQKEENVKMSLTEGQQEVLTPVFESQMPKDDKIHYNISFEAMSPDEAPVVITQNEFMRRMKEMAQTGGGGMSQFYGQMPDNFTIAVNANHPIVIDILADVEKSYGDKLKSITKKIDAAVAEENRFDEVVKGKKEEELTSEEKSTRGAVEEDRHPARRAQPASARDRRRKPPRQADHRLGAADQRHAQGQEPDGFHPAFDFADGKIVFEGFAEKGPHFRSAVPFSVPDHPTAFAETVAKQQKKTTFVCHYKPNQPAMRNLLFLIAAALGALLPSCTPANRVVENPLIETANTRTLDIVKVELSDTATVLHMNAYYRPKNWIVISSDSYLQIPARKFMLTGAEGITPDSLFWMPKSGRASFVLRFPPLPRGTKSFDFIESDCDDCFKIYGVDLTGKTEYPEYPEGLPKELRKAPKDGPVPDPIFAVGETRVNIHLLGFREGMYKDMTLYINSMLTGHERKDAPIDPETGVATFKFGQYGPSLIYGNPAGPGSMHLNFWTARETADIYVDLTER